MQWMGWRWLLSDRVEAERQPLRKLGHPDGAVA